MCMLEHSKHSIHRVVNTSYDARCICSNIPSIQFILWCYVAVICNSLVRISFSKADNCIIFAAITLTKSNSEYLDARTIFLDGHTKDKRVLYADRCMQILSPLVYAAMSVYLFSRRCRCMSSCSCKYFLLCVSKPANMASAKLFERD